MESSGRLRGKKIVQNVWEFFSVFFSHQKTRYNTRSSGFQPWPICCPCAHLVCNESSGNRTEESLHESHSMKQENEFCSTWRAFGYAELGIWTSFLWKMCTRMNSLVPHHIKKIWSLQNFPEFCHFPANILLVMSSNNGALRNVGFGSWPTLLS